MIFLVFSKRLQSVFSAKRRYATEWFNSGLRHRWFETFHERALFHKVKQKFESKFWVV